MQTLAKKLKKEGKIEGKTEIVRNMLNENIALEKIMKYTGFTQEEILQIKKGK